MNAEKPRSIAAISSLAVAIAGSNGSGPGLAASSSAGVAPGETAVHDLFKQEKLLIDWAKAHATKQVVHTNGLKAHAEPA